MALDKFPRGLNPDLNPQRGFDAPRMQSVLKEVFGRLPKGGTAKKVLEKLKEKAKTRLSPNATVASPKLTAPCRRN